LPDEALVGVIGFTFLTRDNTLELLDLVELKIVCNAIWELEDSSVSDATYIEELIKACQRLKNIDNGKPCWLWGLSIIKATTLP